MSEEQQTPSELKVLGATIGTFEDWDQFDVMDFVFYNMTLYPGFGQITQGMSLDNVKLMLQINYDTGIMTAETVNGDGDIVESRRMRISWSLLEMPQDDSNQSTEPQEGV